ncbi:MAG TPA: helix-turn-helix transcriptional regulator [Pyrinomonadaceae bacterium]
MGRSNRPTPARLAVKLAQIRAVLNLTQEQMIERLKYTASPLYPSYISGFETGEREPPLLVLLAYARCAGISTDVLIDDRLDLPDKLARIRGHKRSESRGRPRKT